MSRFTLAKDFHNIDPASTRIILIEAGPQILASFKPDLAAKAKRDLEKLGVQVWTNARVTDITDEGVQVGDEFIASKTVLWAAGVAPAPLNQTLGIPLDTQGRIIVQDDLSIASYPNVFAAGDQAHVEDAQGKALPGLAPVAKQQGIWIGKQIKRSIAGQTLKPFTYLDKGQMATIGRNRAVAQIGKVTFTGWLAWIVWLIIHIYYLCGFSNRVTVIIRWAFSYFRFSRGARLIVTKNWQLYDQPTKE